MSSLTRLSLANRLVVVLVSAFIVVAGIVSAAGLRQELLPSIQPPSASIVATYAGASPTSVEKAVTGPLEDAVRAVPGVDTVTSTSSSGVSRITVGWAYGLDAQKLIQDLRSAVAAVNASLPSGVAVETYAGSTDDLPALQLAVTSTGDPGALGEQMRRTLVPAVKAVAGVRDVTLTGLDEDRLVVTMRPGDARAKAVTSAQVQSVLSAAIAVTSAGTSRDGATVLPVEVGTVPTSADQVAALAIPTEKGPVAVGDVADVAIEKAPPTSLARLNGEPALTISITKAPEASVVSFSHEVARVIEAERAALGSGVQVTTIFDQAPHIEQSLHDLTTEGALGLVFAIGVILVFLLSTRATVITAISIPLSLLIAMVGLAVGGFSLSVLTLAALTIAVGRVVDDSIVVIENIQRHCGSGELTAARIVGAVREVAGAITASTLTTVAVFAPIAFVSGVTGELFRPFAVTVTIALVASLLVSLTVVPVLASWVMRRPPRPLSPEKSAARRARRAAWAEREAARRARRSGRSATVPARSDAVASVAAAPTDAGALSPAVSDAAASAPEDAGARSAALEPLDRLQSAYLPILHLALRRPIATLIVGALVFAMTVGASGALRLDFLDDGGGRPTVSVTQTMPPGTSLHEASDRVARVENVLQADTDVETAITTVTESGASHTAILADEADIDSTMARLRAEFAGLSDVGRVSVQSASATGGSDLTVTVSGGGEDALAAGAEQVRAALAELRDLDDLRSDAVADQPLLSVTLDSQRAAQYGFTQAEVGQAIADSLRGTSIGTIDGEGDAREVILRGQANDASLEQIGALELPVSAVQQAAAQKRAADVLTAAQEAQEADAAAQQDKSLTAQLAEARSSRSAAQRQLTELTAQRAAVVGAPLPVSGPWPSPDPQLDPAEAAAQQAGAAQDGVDALANTLAEAQRQEQITQLEQAISQAQEAISQLGEQIDTLIRAADETATRRAQASALADQQKALADVRATPIQVRDIATVQRSAGVSVITRTDGIRAITLSATPTGDDPTAVLQNVRAALEGLDLPDGVTAHLGGAAIEQDDSLTELALAMLAAIGIVFLVMAATFRSLVQPLILLIAIPFAATGAVLLLLATGTPLGVPAMIGMLMLIGIVVTNAIVLVDLVNSRRAAGDDLTSAVIDGARLRLRPILMTAAATIFALVPMALGLTGSGVFISQALAMVVIGGLVTSTVLTLLLVPVLYLLVERRKERRALVRGAASSLGVANSS